MPIFNAFLVFLAQTRTDTGKTNQTSWELIIIVVILAVFVATALFVRRARRAHGEPPAGSVPSSEVRHRDR